MSDTHDITDQSDVSEDNIPLSRLGTGSQQTDEQPADMTAEPVSLELIMRMMRQMNTNLSAQINTSQTDVLDKINDINTNLGTRLDSVNTRFDTTDSKIAEANKQVTEKVAAVKQTLDEHVASCEAQNKKITTRLEAQDEKLSKLEENLTSNQDRLKQLETDVANVKDSGLNNNDSVSASRVELKTDKLTEDLTNLTTSLGTHMRDLNKKSDMVERKVGQLEDGLSKLKLGASTAHPSVSPLLGSLNFPGFGKTEKIPIFNNYRVNPIKFLVLVKEYVDRLADQRWSHVKAVLDVAFHDSSDYWYESIRDNFSSLEAFEVEFRERYWSERSQSLVRESLDSGRYEPNKKLSPSAYFLLRINTLKYLQPPINEGILITKMGFHFGDQVRLAIKYQGINTIDRMAKYLVDTEDETLYRNRQAQERKRPYTAVKDNENQGAEYGGNRNFRRPDNFQRFENNFRQPENNPHRNGPGANSKPNNDNNRFGNNQNGGRFNRYNGPNREANRGGPNKQIAVNHIARGYHSDEEPETKRRANRDRSRSRDSYRSGKQFRQPENSNRGGPATANARPKSPVN